jgi:hypothetical protein
MLFLRTRDIDYVGFVPPRPVLHFVNAFHFYGVGPKWNYKNTVIYVIITKSPYVSFRLRATTFLFLNNIIETGFVEVKSLFLVNQKSRTILKVL